MSEKEDFNPIESTLYIRQRKTLLSVSLIIIAINLIGGKLKTGQDGSSTFILPFGVTFDISRPWLIDWLLFSALLYLVIRYVIFSRFVRRYLDKSRKECYRYYIHSLDKTLLENSVRIVDIDVQNKLWKWTYTASEFNSMGDYVIVKENEPLPTKLTFWPAIKTELKLFQGKNAYTDYYSPFVVMWLAILSYLVKLWT